MTRVNYPWFKREDIDAFFALFQNNLANFVLIAIILLGMGFPASIVFGKIITGAAVAVLAGNLYYAYMAKRLAEKENRSDVTALSYGISTPVMFVFLFGVLKPALDLTGDPEMAWKIGVAAAMIGGIIEAAGSVIGPWVRDNLPRAAMLGALAGVAFTFIGGELFFKTFTTPAIGMVVMAIILMGLFAKVTMPFRIPATAFAIILGTVLAYALGKANVKDITDGLSHVGFYPILPTAAAFEGFGMLFGPMIGLLAILIPISMYNFIETMNNVEAMASAGDSYNVREAQFADGVGTVLGALFGGVFPTTVYIASVGSKWMNAGRGYSVLNGGVFALAAMVGLIAAISKIIPIAVIAPILVFVGLSMVSQAFTSTPKRHAPAVAIAMMPYLANYIMTRFNTAAPDVVARISPGLVPLGQGAMFSALIWGAITVFIIERQFAKATIFSLVGALLSFVGVMHAPKLAINAAPEYVLGYVIMGVMFAYFHFTQGVKQDGNEVEKDSAFHLD
ncbi:MAG: NCS2 family permease [Clostridia bacterium]|nr:NCS2 family permease [Clostridia bacterium]